MIRLHLRVCLQLKEVQLWTAANCCSNPGGGQHDPCPAVDATDLEGLQDRIVPVQGDANDHVAGQVNAKDATKGHYPAHEVTRVPLYRRIPGDLQRDHDKGDEQIRNGQVHQHCVDAGGGA